MSAPLLFDFDQQLLASTLTPNSPKKPERKEPPAPRQQQHHPQHQTQQQQQYTNNGQMLMCPEYDYSSLMGAPPDYSQDGVFKQPQMPVSTSSMVFNPLSNTMSSQHPAQYVYASPMLDNMSSQGYATPAMTFSASTSSCNTSEVLSPMTDFMSPDLSSNNPNLLLPADQVFSPTMNNSPNQWSNMNQFLCSSPQPQEVSQLSGSSGSSYRGSTDEFMQASMGINMLAGLGLANSPDPTLTPAPQTGYTTPQHSVNNSPVTPLKQSPIKSHTIVRETRKGQDLGLELEDFEMLETLGTGTFGRVLLCRLLRNTMQGLPQYFAMKVLAKYEVVRLKQIQHINSERAILGSVRHHGIVNLFCTFQDERNLYILMEFVQGGELFSHLRRAGRFSADVSRFYAANIILALEYLHDRNIIYRDLKPENLLLDQQGYLKVTDFGFAKHVPDRTYTLCGTPEYLAPEIIQSTGHGKAADYWAFGVLLFEMLCGYPCFYADSPLGIYEKILSGKVNFPSHVDPVARDLITKLLSTDLSRRLGNLRGGIADIMNHQWFEGVDWNMVRRREIPAPIIPRVKTAGDCAHFEKYERYNLNALPALARAQHKRTAMQQGTWREPNTDEERTEQARQDREDQFKGFFFEF